ncbi:hypothetical protein Syun_019523 [Stephania yunnanensis]|uniref:Uncharacterized protein n=1 Tax=Stephania yunnanensis TaxID=152371 RepID=A0AAP0IWN2_9MAGN
MEATTDVKVESAYCIFLYFFSINNYHNKTHKANNGGVLAGLAACRVTMDIIATVASDLCRTSRQVTA